MADIVIDTSVIVKWYSAHQEAGFERARVLLHDHARKRGQLHVPLLALYETGNALRYGSRLSVQEQLRCLTDLFALGLAVHPLTVAGATLAHEVSCLFDVSFYDACFVALAQELRLSFVTADERLCRRLSSLPTVCPLASFGDA